MIIEEIKKDIWKIDEKHHLKKERNSYRVIYPIKDSNGKFIWKNFLIGGRWSNLFFLIFVLTLVIYLSWGHKADINAFEKYIKENCVRVSPYSKVNEYLSIPSLQVDVDEYGLLVPSSDNDEILK